MVKFPGGKRMPMKVQNLRGKYVDSFDNFWKDMKVLLLEKVYVVNVLGYIAYNFVIGAYSYWGPKAGYNIYHMSILTFDVIKIWNLFWTEQCRLFVRGVTAVCGIFGTVAGGLVLDRMTSTISNAFKAPVNFVCLHSVKPSLRPLSMAISTVSIHIFGDVPSSPLVGLLQDHVNNWRATALILTSVLFLAAAIWFIGVFLNSVDRYNEDSENPVTPLLEEKA
ncbi:UNVERIFIED_CONTAM: putative sphingolipid transporter spinster2 [Sesamum calycinum]|uniref:Sphingolipid transporter spinster2 n=1 Tax=Sesamum calycinum TaxID=2727403 RepID=A0AAW2R7C3_9LAMI